MTNPFDLSGKTALVTGANTGLGQGMAIALANAGSDIVLVGRTAPKDTIRRIKAAGRTAYDVRADLMKTDAAKGALNEAIGAAGQVDILVNNAGIIRRSDAVDFSESDWDDVMDVNLKNLFSSPKLSSNIASIENLVGRLLMLRLCCLFRVVFVWRLIRRRNLV